MRVTRRTQKQQQKQQSAVLTGKEISALEINVKEQTLNYTAAVLITTTKLTDARLHCATQTKTEWGGGLCSGKHYYAVDGQQAVIKLNYLCRFHKLSQSWRYVIRSRITNRKRAVWAVRTDWSVPVHASHTHPATLLICLIKRGQPASVHQQGLRVESYIAAHEIWTNKHLDTDH